MSVKAIGYVFDLEGIAPTDKFVLLAYVDHASHNGENIFPAVDTIAKKTGFARRTVQRSTKELEHLGLLISDGQGPNGTNKWKLNMNWQRVTERQGDPEAEGGVRESPPGVTENPSRGVRESPKPSLTVNTTVNKPILPSEGADAPAASVQAKQKPLNGMPKRGKQKTERPEAVEVYRRIFGRYPRKDVWADIAERVAGRLEAWEAACKAWKLQAYKPTNYTGIFDWIDGIPDYAKPNGGKSNGRSNSRSRRGGRRRQTHEEHLAEVRAEAKRLQALGV